MSKIKVERLSEQFKRNISVIITKEIRDSRLPQNTSVTDVEVTPDLMFCKVFVSAPGDKKTKEKALDALNHAKGFIKTKLSKQVEARKVPELIFVLDSSIEYGNRIESLIADLHNEGSDDDK